MVNIRNQTGEKCRLLLLKNCVYKAQNELNLSCSHAYCSIPTKGHEVYLKFDLDCLLVKLSWLIVLITCVVLIKRFTRSYYAITCGSDSKTDA